MPEVEVWVYFGDKFEDCPCKVVLHFNHKSFIMNQDSLIISKLHKLKLNDVHRLIITDRGCHEAKESYQISAPGKVLTFSNSKISINTTFETG